ncbi:MAG: histidine kinase [Clostridiales bacterium]|nr:histidine kinase [Clostridiales bacterium]
MNLYKRLIEYINNMKFKTKLNATYIILIIVPIMIMSIGYYKRSSDIIIKNAQDNMYKVVRNNTKDIDMKLGMIKDSADAIAIDHDLFTILNHSGTYSGCDLVKLDKTMNNIIYKYFSAYSDIYSAHIVTSYYPFGSSRMFIPLNYFKSRLYKEAVEANGSLKWIATYDFGNMYDLNDFKNIDFEYKYIFSAVKMINCTDIMDNNFTSLPGNIEKPILIINFTTDIFTGIVEMSNPMKGSKYYIFSPEGDTVYSSDISKPPTQQDSRWLTKEITGETGTIKKRINGENLIICYDKSRITGWVSAAVIPVNVLLEDLSKIRSYIFLTGIILIIACIFSANIMSLRMTEPIKKLLVAIKKMGEGDFHIRIEINGKDEIAELVKKFNEMDEKIKNLIEENYVRRIREKESTIMALNIQLNPHFLYNTLNTINWIAIENNQKEISKIIMSLADMLHYTAYNEDELTFFGDDLKWLKNYIYIMQNRFDDKFTVYYDIDPKLNLYKVPKLFLQPFVENSILHGFDSIDTGGILKIRGWVNSIRVCFSVEDNGRGIEKEKGEKMIQHYPENIGIKNVEKRIKLIYGEEYGIRVKSILNKGTKVLIELPIIDGNNTLLQ